MSLELKDPPASVSVLPPVPGGAKKRVSVRQRRMILYGGIGILIIAIIAIAVVHHRHMQADTTASANDTAVVTRGDIEKSVEAAGKVVSANDVDIKCRASGLITELPVDISQTVKKDQLLCKLDQTDEKLAVEVAERTVAQSTAKLEQARLNYEQAQLNLETTRSKEESALESAKVKAANLLAKAERQRQLKAQKLGSVEDLETAETDAAAAKDGAAAAQVAVNELKQQELAVQGKKLDMTNAEAQLIIDQLNLDTQKQQLNYTTVVSPIDGTVSALTSGLRVGAMVQSGTGGFSGGTTIMTLSDLSRKFVIASVDQSDIGHVQVGQAARVEVDSFPGRGFEGKVVLRPPSGNSASNVVTFDVKIEVTDKDKHLLDPVVTGTVTIIEDQRKNVLMVPIAAVSHRTGQTYVTLAGGEKRVVTLGMEGNENVEVLSGLFDGDKVVVEKTELPTRWKASDGGPK